MAKVTYEQARQDHEYLWAIGPADDMTGGYVDQEDLAKLLRSPSKATARDCYVSQIEYWFQHGPERVRGQSNVDELIASDPALAEIAERYGY